MAVLTEVPPPPGPYDGVWEVVMSSNIHKLMPGAHDFGLAQIVTNQGKFSGTDNGGCTWSGEISPVSGDNSKVHVVVTVDPRTGPADAFVMHLDGQIRRAPITHTLDLNVTYINNRMILRGTLNIAPFILDAQLRKLKVS